MSDDTLLQDQPLGHKLMKKWFWLYFFMLLTAPVWYIIKAIISNTLSVEDVGLFYSVLWLILLLSNYNDLWLTEALQYYLPTYRIQKAYNKYKTILYITISIQVVVWTILAALMYFFADWIAIHHFKSPQAAQIIRTLCWFFIGNNFLQTFQSIFISFQDTKSSNITNTSNLYSTLIFATIFWLSQSLTIDTFALSWIGWVFVGIVVAWLFFVYSYRHTLRHWKFIIEKQVLNIQLKYAFWVFLWANVGSLLWQVDQQLVVNFLWSKQAWYYSNFFTLLSLYNIVITPILSIVFPLVTELITKKDFYKLQLLQNILYKVFSVLVLSVWWLFLAFWPEISVILFGQKFLPSGQLTQYIAPFLIFNALLSINFWILAGMWKAKQRVSIIAWALLVNLLFNLLFVLVFHWWLYGTVYALAAGWVVLWYLSFRMVHRQQPIQFDWKFFLWNFFVIALLSLLFLSFKSNFFVPTDEQRRLCLKNIVFVIFWYYLIIAWINYKSIRALIGEFKLMRSLTK